MQDYLIDKLENVFQVILKFLSFSKIVIFQLKKESKPKILQYYSKEKTSNHHNTNLINVQNATNMKDLD